ncbi:HD domain-containing phosphohydrolase [Sedimenticola sp.]|uniref:HD domain-containing phosphohydrolase n=1 Tax=Sedimenticola sp. TaxID=1940285 RepID=UPI003D106A51
MDNKPSILIVDDESFYLDLLLSLLLPLYKVSVAKNGDQAIKRANAKHPPLLILLDVIMPGMDGYQVCEKLKLAPSTSDIPIVFLTGKSEVDDEIRGLELGAVDYISKPISPPILLARVKNHLALAQQHIALEGLVMERTEQIEKTKDAVTYSMGALAEARDNETSNHLKRTQQYVRILAEKLNQHESFHGHLNAKTVDMITSAAPLHDIGKIDLPDRILCKPSKFSEEEKLEMNKHTLYGRTALEKAESDIGHIPYLKIAKEITYCHHERWDGSGYPEGLKEGEIPLAARLMAVADVYDALISKRHYRRAFSHEEAVTYIENNSGAHFDPLLVEIFKHTHEEFNAIANRYTDSNPG